MPKYIVQSDTPITATEVGDGGGTPEHPWVPPGVGIWPSPGRPGHPIYPTLPPIPPIEEWPPLPPHISLPIPPTPSHPIAPVPPGEEEPPTIWPPVKPEFPDLSGKTLALAVIYVSRHEPLVRWVVIDHEEAKEAFKDAVEKVKGKLPAGGVAGRPPERPTPSR